MNLLHHRTGTTYSMVNGSETTLMFMIKATLPESQAETDGQGKR